MNERIKELLELKDSINPNIGYDIHVNIIIIKVLSKLITILIKIEEERLEK